MKALKPSMREKKRYLLINGNNLEENTKKAIFDFIGILGMSKTNLRFIKKNKNSIIIQVNREALNHVRASFAVSQYKINIKKVSGTLKGLK